MLYFFDSFSSPDFSHILLTASWIRSSRMDMATGSLERLDLKFSGISAFVFIRRELLLAGIKGEDRDRKVERKLPYPLIYMCYRTPTQEVIRRN